MTISGCWIITGNVVIIYEIGELLLQGTESFGYEHVDLSTESDWNDHKEQLKKYTEYFEKRVDPRNRTYYWHGHVPKTSFENPDADAVALDRNYISITPIKCDMTDYSLLEELKGWEIGKKK